MIKFKLMCQEFYFIANHPFLKIKKKRPLLEIVRNKILRSLLTQFTGYFARLTCDPLEKAMKPIYDYEGSIKIMPRKKQKINSIITNEKKCDIIRV